MVPARLRAVVLAAIAGVVMVLGIAASPAGAAPASIPFGQTQTGTATFYNNAGFGACGSSINAATDMLVAVSSAWFTSANSNTDPLCNGVSVQVTYNGTTITVPVEDKCPSCDASHIDLSQPAFGKFASTDPVTTPGVLNVTWKFVSSSGTPSGPTGPITGFTGLCLDDRSASTANFNPIQVFTCNGTSAQQWTVEPDNTLQVLGECLDVAGAGTANGTLVDLYPCNGTGAQVWEPQSNGELINPNSGKCLDDTGFGGSGTQVQIWSCTDGANQQWTLP